MGEFEEKLKKVFSKHLREYLNEVVESVSSKKSLLVSFQDCFEKVIIPNQLTIKTLEMIPKS